jgi:hypothetical protein
LTAVPVIVRSAFAAVAAVALLAPAPASATIIPGRGMAGVTLRMTEAQVEARP